MRRIGGMGGGHELTEAMDIAKKVVVGITIFASVIVLIGVVIGLVVGLVIDYQLLSILGKPATHPSIV
jgi:predicted lysophospholipase L1 biosynthesis ABC-type transport system permease subunit